MRRIRGRLTVLLHRCADTADVTTQVFEKEPQNLALASAARAEISFPNQTLAAPVAAERLRVHGEVGRYRLRLAQTVEDRDAACRLRFKVFNIELGEGLESSYRTGLDRDEFDPFCDHLLVEDKLEGNPARRIVGTYRMQSGASAARNVGYYSAQEFDLAPFEPLRAGILELGRASIDREHRTPEVLTLLWRGIAQYATDMGLRYVIGCSSLNSTDPAEGWQVYGQLEAYRVTAEFETRPTARYVCPAEQQGHCAQPQVRQEMPTHTDHSVKIPRLLKTYLAIGARIAAAPAWDREFGTIDFLTLLDLKSMSAAARHRFLAPLTQ